MTLRIQSKQRDIYAGIEMTIKFYSWLSKNVGDDCGVVCINYRGG